MKIMSIIGTRPEAIKMAPLIKKIAQLQDIKNVVVSTGQHREMLDNVLQLFEIKTDYDLDIMKRASGLVQLTSCILEEVSKILIVEKPDLVLVHGDTTTAFASALAAFYQKIKIGHVEAGLRSRDIFSPWPEELNRKFISTVASLNFCPTEYSSRNLILEGVMESDIFVTGNTVIDALFLTQKKINKNNTQKKYKSLYGLDADKNSILVTAHRRENHGDGIKNICVALKRLALEKKVQVIFPLHLSPAVRGPIERELLDVENVFLIKPLDYPDFVEMMDYVDLILTDSGGVQEEAPSIGKPVLVLRKNTERPEAIEAGSVKLVGTDADVICRSVLEVLDSSNRLDTSANINNPYGNGTASDQIVSIIMEMHSKGRI